VPFTPSRASVSVWGIALCAWAVTAVWMVRATAAAGGPTTSLSGSYLYFCTIGTASHVHSAAALAGAHLAVMFPLMLVAMMLPTLLPMLRYLAATNLRRRRVRVLGCFVCGYFAVWLLAGAAVWLIVRLAVAALSYRIRRRARRHQVTYSYLFMKASGDQLRELTALIDAGIIRPVVDSVFDFDQTREALAHLEQGRTKAGKVVIRMK